MMLANDLKTYYDEVRRYLDCPKDEQDRLLFILQLGNLMSTLLKKIILSWMITK